MPTDILLRKLQDRSLVCLELTSEQLELVIKNRPETANEKKFNKQLERAKNPHKYIREY